MQKSRAVNSYKEPIETAGTKQKRGIKIYNQPSNDDAPVYNANKKKLQPTYDGKRLDIRGSSTRKESNWNSSIFDDGKATVGKRNRLAKADAGKGGLFGE